LPVRCGVSRAILLRRFIAVIFGAAAAVAAAHDVFQRLQRCFSAPPQVTFALIAATRVCRVLLSPTRALRQIFQHRTALFDYVIVAMCDVMSLSRGHALSPPPASPRRLQQDVSDAFSGAIAFSFTMFCARR